MTWPEHRQLSHVRDEDLVSLADDCFHHFRVRPQILSANDRGVELWRQLRKVDTIAVSCLNNAVLDG
jgi:hypothetical protein